MNDSKHWMDSGTLQGLVVIIIMLISHMAGLDIEDVPGMAGSFIALAAAGYAAYSRCDQNIKRVSLTPPNGD